MELTHTRLLVDSFKECFVFYRDVMGFEPVWGTEDGTYADFRAGNTVLALYSRKDMAASINGSYASNASHIDRVVIVFRVKDVDAAFQSLKSKVHFLLEPTSTPYGILIELYHEIPME
jgi:catechol 2,3-dioxygenase-like lactoylglutathione lyase family enzyme